MFVRQRFEQMIPWAVILAGALLLRQCHMKDAQLELAGIGCPRGPAKDHNE